MAQEGRKREKDETGCQQPAGRILCANNCGCFGSEATMNFCSKCYGEVVLKKAVAVTATAVGQRSTVSALSEKALTSLSPNEKLHIAEAKTDLPVHDVRHEQVEPLAKIPGSPSKPLRATVSCQWIEQKPEIPKVPNRCFTCRKRVGLTGFKCRCGGLFCALHRYSDEHTCSFDYKAAARAAIAKANPVVKADKIAKI